MEKEKRENCLPLAVECLAAAMFVLICSLYQDLLSKGSLHGGGIFLSLS